MPKPRSSGFNSSMRLSSSEMAPPVMVSRPAMQLRAVDLPHPDGPSSAMNSPRSMVRDTSFSALKLPKARLTRSRRICWNGDAALCTMVDTLSRDVGSASSNSGGAASPRHPRLQGGNLLLDLVAADLLVPDVEGLHELGGLERCLDRIVGDPVGVFGPAKLVDGDQTNQQRHRE